MGGSRGQQSQGLGFMERPGSAAHAGLEAPACPSTCFTSPGHRALGGRLLSWGQQEWAVLAFVLA